MVTYSQGGQGESVLHRSDGGGEGLALTLVEDRFIGVAHLQAGICKNINLFRAGHIAKAYGVTREGSGYR